MEPETTANLLTSLTCLAPFCLGLLGLVAVGFLFVWLIRRQRQPRDAAALAAERQGMRSQVEQQTAGLRPWSSAALADLSTDWDARWTRFGRKLDAHGTIPSLSEPKGPPWVAFSLKVRGARRPDGQLLARTTDRAFDYRLTPEGVAIQVDGAPLGQVQSDGTLLGADGQPIGSAPRPGGMPAMFRVGGVSRLRDQRERSYPVTLHGRTVGHVAHPPAKMINVISLKKREFPPAVAPEASLSETEATWLLALAILQVAGYNLLETVWTN